MSKTAHSTPLLVKERIWNCVWQNMYLQRKTHFLYDPIIQWLFGSSGQIFDHLDHQDTLDIIQTLFGTSGHFAHHPQIFYIWLLLKPFASFLDDPNDFWIFRRPSRPASNTFRFCKNFPVNIADTLTRLLWFYLHTSQTWQSHTWIESRLNPNENWNKFKCHWQING